MVPALKMGRNAEYEGKWQAIANLLDAGENISKIARLLKTSRMNVYHVKKRKQAGKSLSMAKRTGRLQTARTKRIVKRANTFIKKGAKTTIARHVKIFYRGRRGLSRKT